MIIEISKRGDLFAADWKELPGSPKVGLGKSRSDAIADLFFMVLRELDKRRMLVNEVDQGKTIEIVGDTE